MNLEDYRKEGEKVFALFDLSECDTARPREHFEERGNANLPRVTIQKDAFSHFILELAREVWLRTMERRPDFASFCGWWAERLLRQQQALEPFKGNGSEDELGDSRSVVLVTPVESPASIMRALDAISLASRRMVVLYFLDPRNANPNFRREYLRADGAARLPQPSLSIPESILSSPGAEDALLEDASPALVQQFLRTADRLQAGYLARPSSEIEDWPRQLGTVIEMDDEVVVRGGPTETVLEEPANDRDTIVLTGKLARSLRQDAAYTRLQSSQSRLEPVALLCLRYVTQKVFDGSIHECEPSELLFLLVWSLQLLHGLELKTCLRIGINGNTGAQHGYIENGQLILRLGGDRVGQSSAWNETEMRLRLAPECGAVLAALSRHFPGATEIRHCRPSNDSTRAILNERTGKFLRKHFEGYKGTAKQIAKVWVRVGLHLNIERSVLGLCRGWPVPGSRGEDPYLTISGSQARRSIGQIQDAVRSLAGLDPLHQDFEDDAQMHGTIGITLDDYYARTSAHLKAAQNHNDAVALVVRWLRGLGLRKMGGHLNPSYLVRKLPLPMLVFQDKFTQSWAPERYIPLSACAQAFVSHCGQLFGESEELVYAWDGRPVSFDELPAGEKSRLNELINEPGQYNAGRTAWYNALVRHDIGEAIRQILTGHGPVITHPLGQHHVISFRRLLEITRPMVEPIFMGEGIDRCAEELCHVLAEKVDQTILAAAKMRELDATRSRTKKYRRQVPEGVQAPLSFEEARAYEVLMAKISERNVGQVGTDGQCLWPTSGIGLMGLAALGLGLPFSNLIKFQPYYSFDSVVIDRTSGRIFFLAVGGHHDAGGLYRYPIFVCHEKHQALNPFMQIFSSLYLRAKHNWEHRRPDMESIDPNPGAQAILEDLLFGSSKVDPKDIGQELKFLLETNQPSKIGDDFAFDWLERFSRTKCTYDHPSVLSSNLSGRNELGLNHFEISDLLRFHLDKEVELVSFDGSPWIDRLSFHYAKARQLPNSKLRKPSSGSGLTRWINHFRARQVTPSVTRFRRELINRGVADSKASLMAGKIMQRFREQGWLHCSRPLPLFRRNEYNALVTGTEGYFASPSFKPKTRGRKTSIQGPLEEGLRRDYAGYVKLLKATIMRPRELIELTADSLIAVADQLYAMVNEGKTDAARRVIHVNEFASKEVIHDLKSLALKGQEHLLCYIRAHCKDTDTPLANLKNVLNRMADRRGTPRTRLDALQKAITSASLGSDNLAVRKKWNDALRVASKGDTSAYDIRHAEIIFRTQDLVRSHLAHGNFWYRLASLSVAVGHASMGVTLNTYVGTAVWVLENGLILDEVIAG